MHRAIIFWLTVALLSGCIGYFSLRKTPDVSRINFAGYPETPADESLDVDLWNENLPYIVGRESVVLIHERAGAGGDEMATRFFSPRNPNQDGYVLIRFPLKLEQPIQKAYLTLRPVTFYSFDEKAEVKVELKSEGTQGVFLKLAELGAKTQETSIDESFDVSEYARGATAIEIKITVRASKLLYHPTPNDPIGYAGAQALRHYKRDPVCARLDLWYDKESQPQ